MARLGTQIRPSPEPDLAETYFWVTQQYARDWERVEPRLASESARVLPGRPVWLGIHWTWMVKFVLVVDRCDQMELQTESDW